MRTFGPLCGRGAGLLLAASSAGIAAAQTPLRSVIVASDLQDPLYATHAPGDFERLFIVERGGAGPGRIRIMDLASGVVLPNPFLTVDVGIPVGEEGLFSIAFHPDYEPNGYFYVCHTTSAPSFFVVARYQVSANPNIANPASVFPVLRLPQGSPFHNGGWIGFGADTFLYAALGENADAMSGQTTQNNLRGKVLRLDVNGDDYPGDPDRNYAVPANNPFVGIPGDDEIWAYGLRNPWRCSFDRATQDFWIGDVGQATWEEVNLRPAAAPPSTPFNYGWICYEGPSCIGILGCGLTCTNVPHYQPPAHVYPHTQKLSPYHCSVTAGYVYRGCAIPDLQGSYFFGDFCAGRVWSFHYVGGQVAGMIERTAELTLGGGPNLGLIASFGEDAFGELYMCTLQGNVHKIVPETFVGPDCNENQVRDACDILSGFSRDVNGNGVPDECEECYADCNASASLTIADFACFQARFALGEPYADCTGDQQLTIADFGCFQSKFARGCP